jgi:hypothetical protein
MAIGGRSQSVNLVRRGGLAIGGYSNNTRYVSTGGLAIGGLQIHVQLVRTGGMALGGLSNRSKRVQTGGMAIGGRADRPAETPISGGLAIGGQRSGEGPYEERRTGGLAIGGPSRDPNPIFGEGGLAIGGNVTSAVFPPGGKARYGGLAIGGSFRGGSGVDEKREGGLAIGGLLGADLYPPATPLRIGGLAIGGQSVGLGPLVAGREGGLALGGTHSNGPPPFGPCTGCTETTPPMFTLTISGITGPFDLTDLNGTWTLTQTAPCYWSLTVEIGANSYTIYAEYVSPNWFVVYQWNATGYSSVWEAGTYTCVGNLVDPVLIYTVIDGPQAITLTG